jgi:hypothetical protein
MRKGDAPGRRMRRASFMPRDPRRTDAGAADRVGLQFAAFMVLLLVL